MTKLLLFGATGNLGKEIAKEALQQGYDLTVVVRNNAKAESLSNITTKFIVADITNPMSLTDICAGYEIVISALGKSVSPMDRSKPSFNDIDFVANSNILKEALNSYVKKFVYVSAFHSEKYQHVEYFRVNHSFSELLMSSGINYSIIKPTAIFSGFLDMIDLAKKGQLVNIGMGDKKTNPIYEGDLAKVCVDAIEVNNVIQEAGGTAIYTRKQLLELIQKQVNPRKKLINMPFGLFKFSLPIIKVFNKNLFDKLAFFSEVIQKDTIAPQIGTFDFLEYITKKSKMTFLLRTKITAK